MKKLLLINTNFPPNRSIGTQRLLRLCKYLSRDEWEIYVLTIPLEGQIPEQLEKENWFRQIEVIRTPVWNINGRINRMFARLKRQNKNSAAKGGGKPEAPVRAGAGKNSEKDSFVIHFKKFLASLPEFPDKYWDWLVPAVMAARRLIKRENIDVIFTSSPPHSSHLIGLWAKRLTGVPWVAEFRDPWARSPWHEEERERNVFEIWKHRRIKNWERKIVHKADRIFLITPQLHQEFTGHYKHENPEKFVCLLNGYDPESAAHQPEPVDATRRPLKIVHTGTLYRLRNPEPLMRTVARMLQNGRLKKDFFEFHFVGTITGELEHLPALVQELDLQDVFKFSLPVSYQESLQIQMAADILLLLQPGTILQLPGKFYDYVGMGKPILAIGEPNSAVSQMVDDRFGCFASVHSPEQIETALFTFLTDPNQYYQAICANRSQYSIEKPVEILENQLNKLTSRRG
ncbi:MAG: glycosyltransferase family 4 protein [Calditrichia bacterium]